MAKFDDVLRAPNFVDYLTDTWVDE